MKVPNRQVRWEHEPWTVVTRDGWPYGEKYYYAYNTRTGDRKPERTTYDEALSDVAASSSKDERPHAEPWGV